MIKLRGLIFLLSINVLSAQPDSLKALDLNKIYYNNYAVVENGLWKEGSNNLRIGFNFKNFEDKFDVSNEGKFLYTLAQKQASTSIKGVLVGLGVSFVGLSMFVSTIKKSDKFTVGTGIGSLFILGGTVFTFSSMNRLVKANDNFEKALWYRNRDALLEKIDDSTKVKFKDNYEQNSIYLINNGFVKNGKSQKLGVFGNKIKAEFENIEITNEIFKKYQNYKKTGFALKTLGITGTISSYLLPRNQHFRNSQFKIFVISYPTILIGNMLIMKSLGYLRKAVFIRNKEIVNENY